MSGRNPLHRTPSQQPDETPVVLPHVIITVTDTGALDVTVDGTPFAPPSAGSEWTRGTFGPLLDAVTKDRTIAVRIEVREVDGTVFTDLIRSRKPSPPSPPDDDPTAAPGTRRARRAKHTKQHESSPVLVEVTGEGFVAGEDIAVAVIVSHTDAAGTGAARALLDRRQLDTVLAEGSAEVVLYGRISGTIVVRRVS